MTGPVTNREPLKIKEPYVINRLILIGNGFDLAHGFKTGYKDFIIDYFKNAIHVFKINDSYQDELFEFAYDSSGIRYLINHKEIDSIEDIQYYLNEFKNNKSIKYSYKSEILFNSLQSFQELKWVDIENVYFDHLTRLFEGKRFDLLKALNEELEVISKKLEGYLSKLEIEKKDFRPSPFINNFFEPIKKDEIVTVDLEKDTLPNMVYFVNFNYTPTLDNYFDIRNEFNKDIEIKQSYIHGEIYDASNPIIFGFGDEFDEKYLHFENAKNNELFRNIKSFKYSQTSNYHDLIRFIDSNDYQVCIFGHSCGLSDRTMLNRIFENDNCKSIKIFYHKQGEERDDFFDKTCNISRHFRKNKGLMRDKLVPKPKSCPIPKPQPRIK